MKRKAFTILMIAFTIISSGCGKDSIFNCDNYIQFDKTSVNISNKQGSQATVQIESGIKWKLQFDNPIPNWVTVDKTSGRKSQTITITATLPNTTSGYKIATLTAIPDSRILSPVKLTVLQYDSTNSFK